MSPITKIIAWVSLPIIVLIVLLMNSPFSRSPSDALGLSAEDYAEGRKREAAVFQKVLPRLKREYAEAGLQWGSPVFLRAFKEEEILELWVKKENQFVHFRDYPVLARSGALGPKLAEGDLQVPEGFYFFTKAQMNPQSRFHLSFNVGYPNEFDRAHDRTGTFIMVHGSNVSIGCLPIGDEMIEEVYTLVDQAFQDGQEFCRIHLFPFCMTEENLEKHRESQWFSFWENLREGYHWFEEKGVPPNTIVRNKRYHFE